MDNELIIIGAFPGLPASAIPPDLPVMGTGSPATGKDQKTTGTRKHESDEGGHTHPPAGCRHGFAGYQKKQRTRTIILRTALPERFP